MNNSKANSAEERRNDQENRWRGFLYLALLAQVIAIVGSPTIVVPPRISSQLVRVAVAVAVCASPFMVSLVLLFRQRNRRERVVAWSSLGLSLFWLLIGGSLVKQTLEGP